MKETRESTRKILRIAISGVRAATLRGRFWTCLYFPFFFPLFLSPPRAFHFVGATAKLEGDSSERTVNAKTVLATNLPRGESTVTASSVDRGGEQPRSSVRSEFLRLCRVSAGAAGRSIAAGGGGESTRRTAVNRQGATIPAGRARKRYSAPVPADRSGQLAARPACY